MRPSGHALRVGSVTKDSDKHKTELRRIADVRVCFDFGADLEAVLHAGTDVQVEGKAVQELRRKIFE